MHHSKLIQETSNYINENLTKELSLEILGKCAYLSPYHFHRVFVQFTGKTPMEYVRRKRLASAAKDLLKKDMNIIDISAKYRFDSQDGFCRAFKKYFGITPGEYRNSNFIVSYQERETIERMYTLEIFNKMKCSTKDKIDIFATVDKIIELSKHSRRFGLLSLESHLMEVKELVFKKAIQMLIDGVDPIMIKEILLNYCLSGEYSNKEFLRRILILEGTLLIQEGAKPGIIIEKLSSFMGEDISNEIDKRYNISEKANEQLFDEMKRKCGEKNAKSKETSLLESPFEKIDNRSLQRILRDVDEYTLARALAGASGSTQIKILCNVSRKIANNIYEEVELLENTPTSDIIECQKRILEIIHKLSINGEIHL